MGYGIDRGFGYSDSMHGSSASDLAEEVMRARRKFPGRRFLLAALTEEVGELAKAYLQREGADAIRKEALQVACVAMRIYEEGDETFDDVVEEASRGPGGLTWLRNIAAAIRALPLPEDALTLLARDVAREWRDYRDDGSLLVPHEAFIDALTALLDAMAEGWDVVEEGEGDG